MRGGLMVLGRRGEVGLRQFFCDWHSPNLQIITDILAEQLENKQRGNRTAALKGQLVNSLL